MNRSNVISILVKCFLILGQVCQNSARWLRMQCNSVHSLCGGLPGEFPLINGNLGDLRTTPSSRSYACSFQICVGFLSLPARCSNSMLAAFGGQGYAHIPRYVGGWMRARKFFKPVIKDLLIRNPERELEFE